MEWTGHRTTSTFLRYRISSLAAMRRAALTLIPAFPYAAPGEELRLKR
jgi:hypothetical protein